MKKRLLALCLAAALLLGMMPSIALPIGAETMKQKHPVVYAEEIVVDGIADEGAWVLLGKMTGRNVSRAFGSAWGPGTLYLAVKPDEKDTVLTVKLGSVTLSVDKTTGVSGVDGAVAVWGADVVELSVPAAAVGLSMTNFNQSILASLSMGGATWSGNLVISSATRNKPGLTMSTATDGDYRNLSYTTTDEGFTMANKYVEGAKNINRETRVAAYQYMDPIETDTISLEFTFKATAMPAYARAKELKPHLCYAGLGCAFMYGNDEQNGINAAITNSTDKGLQLVVMGTSNIKGYEVIHLNRQVGDTFNIRFERDLGGIVKVYVDDTLLAEVYKPAINSSWGRIKNIFNMHLHTDDDYDFHPAADGSNDIEFTVTNLRTGWYNDDVLKDLNIADFLGENKLAEAVNENLNLLTDWVHPRLGSQMKLTWTSSNPSVIGNDGTVKPTFDNEKVVLTAACDVGTKNFTVIVPKKSVQSYFTVEYINVDGKLDEISWRYSNVRDFAALGGNGAPTGKVSALMKDGIAYVAVQHTGAKTMTLNLGDKQYVIDLTKETFTDDNMKAAIGEGVVELQFNMEALGMPVRDYGQEVPFHVVLGNDSGETALDTKPMVLVFAQARIVTPKDVQTEAPDEVKSTVVSLPTDSANSFFEDRGNLSGSAQTPNGIVIDHPRTNRIYWSKYTVSTVNVDTLLSVLDFEKEVLFEQTLDIDAMPLTTGRYDSPVRAVHADGYLILLEDNSDRFISAVVYNSGSGKLKLKLMLNTSGTQSAAIDLGKTVGDDPFKLGILRTIDGNVSIYVDGELKGTVEGATVSASYNDKIALVMSWKASTASASKKITMKVTDLKLTVTEREKTGPEVVEIKSTSADLKADLGVNPTATSVIIRKGNTTHGYWARTSNLSALSFDKDMLFEQTLKITSMPVSTGMGAYSKPEGYQVVLGTSNMNLGVVIFNDGNGLKARVMTGNNMGTEPIDLGKALGDQFVLGIKREANGKVTILVDDDEKGVCENSIYKTTLWKNMTYRLSYYGANCSATNKIDMTITNQKITVTEPTAAEVVPLLPVDSALRSRFNLTGDANNTMRLESVGLNKDTNNAYWILQSGIDDMDFTKDLMIEQKIRVEQMMVGTGDFVGGAPHKGSGYNLMMEWYDAEGEVFYLSTTLFNSGEGLKLRVMKSTGKTEVIDLGKNLGDTFLLGMKRSAEDVFTVFVDGVEIAKIKGVALAFGSKIYGKPTLKGSYQDNNAADDTPVKMFVSNVRMVADTPIKGDVIPIAGNAGNDTYGAVCLENSIVLDGSKMKDNISGWYLKAPGTDSIKVSELADTDKDMMLVQTLKIDALAESNGKFTSPMEGKGYVIQMEDYATGKSKLYSATVYNSGDGKLELRFMTADGQSSSPIALGKKLGDTFKLGILWRYDNTASVYVNDNKVGGISGYVHQGDSKFGRSAIGMYTADTTARITVTDFHFMAVKFDMVEDLPSLGEELSPSVLFPGVNLDQVRADLVMPTKAHSKWLGELPLTWASTNEGCLTAAGKVTRPDTKANAYTVLSAIVVGGNKIWDREVAVVALKEMVDQTPAQLQVPFTSKFTENWSLNTKVLANMKKVGNVLEGKKVGVFGVKWNLTYIYVAVRAGNNPVGITVNGHTVNVTADNSYTKTNPFDEKDITYVIIPYKSVGLKTPTDYNMETTMTITLGDGKWEGKLVLTSNETFMVNGEFYQPEGGVSMGKTDTNSKQTEPTDNQASRRTTTGIYLYDHYDPDGNNPWGIREYAIYMGGGARFSHLYDPIGDMTRTTYCEFDVQIKAMPIYTDGGETTEWSPTYPNYGLCWALVGGGGSGRPGINVGIYNSKDGLVFKVAGKPGTIKLNKYVGDQFRIAVRWELDESLSVYVDGVKIAHIEDAETTIYQYGNKALLIGLIRNTQSAEGNRDNMDVYIDNISVAKGYGDNVLDLLDYDTVLASNTDEYEVTKKLKLPKEIINPQTGWELDVNWTSDNEKVVSTTGKVTRPRGVGKLVHLTASYGNIKKTFEVYVEAQMSFSDILYVQNDTDTANGVGQKKDFYEFTLDETNNSIIFDQKEIKRVNVITLTDSDNVNRLNESVLSIWVSDDNKTYERVDLINNFKILRDGDKTYLYDFVATGRYIKVHCMHYDGDDADFTGRLENMISVSYQEVFGAEGGFAVNKTVTVSNPKNYTSYDDAWKISLADAGVKAGTEKSIRVYLGNELLYHYVEGSNIVVRIPEIAAKGSVKLRVLSGNANAKDISNREYVHEVVYGTREVTVENTHRWFCALPDGRMFGVMQMVAPEYQGIKGADYVLARTKYIAYTISEDGGLTWSTPKMIEESWSGEEKDDGTIVGNLGEDGWINEAVGIMYDPEVGEQGRIIVTGYYYVRSVANSMANSLCLQRFMYSDDLGETWHRSNEVVMEGDNETRYQIGYSDPIRLSCFDGEGPNVDYVMSCAVRYDDRGGFLVRPIYSCDAGINWTMTASKVDLEAGAGITAIESGTSEGWITERKSDKALVLHSRCQYGNSDRFAIAFSYDHGKTWTKASLSNIYASSGQPVINDFGSDQILVWGGNHALGTNSYNIMPMTIGVMTEDLLNVTNIHDIYSRMSMQGMTDVTEIRVINQSVDSAGNTLTVNYWSRKALQPQDLRMRIDNIYEYLYRTKGVYDSFENSTVKYEGWSITGGIVNVSKEQYTDGKSSMKLSTSGSVVRTVPYLQNGSVSYNLYVEDASKANLTFELEAAYAEIYGVAAPVAFRVVNGELIFLGSNTASGLKLKNGWNTVTMNVNLAAAKPAASISLNGSTAMAMPVDVSVGAYVCYVDIRTTSDCYVDAFAMTDTMPVELPEKIEEPNRCLLQHRLVKTEGIPVTVNFDGIRAYWTCTACGKHFLDDHGTVEFTDRSQLHIPKLGAEKPSTNVPTEPTDPPVDVTPQEDGVNVVLIVVLATLLVAAIATGGVILYRKKFKKEDAPSA